MARLLVGQNIFDHTIAIAPEGHIYGYFFERMGVDVLSVYTDPPPSTRVESVENLSKIFRGNVLLIEDDVVSGSTLRIVVAAIGGYDPGTLSLYLGHAKCFQRLQNVPPGFSKIYIAEDCLDPRDRQRHEDEFAEFFGKLYPR